MKHARSDYQAPSKEERHEKMVELVEGERRGHTWVMGVEVIDVLERYDEWLHSQGAEGKIPPDEPVFLLRAQDVVAPNIVWAWAKLAMESGAATDIVDAALVQHERMKAWQREHTSKVPDMPYGTEVPA